MKTRSQRAKRPAKRLTALLVALVLAITSCVPVFAADPADPTELNITFSPSDKFSEAGGVYTANNTEGNNVIPSNVSAKTFDISLNVQLKEAKAGADINNGEAAATIIFGYAGGRFHGVEFKQIGANINVTSFVDGDPDHSHPNNYIFQDIAVNGKSIVDAPIPVRLTMDENNKLTVYVDGTEVKSHTFAKTNGADAAGIAYYGGQLGIMTWQSLSTFEYTAATTTDAPPEPGDFKTNIEGDWLSSGGTWNELPSGMQGANTGLGDVFYTSEQNIPADATFILEADMHLESGVAAGITFGIGNRNDPLNPNQWYCGNVDKTSKITKIFGPGFSEQRALTDEELEKKDFHLRIEYLPGGRMNFLLDGELVGTRQVDSFTGGYIGIMTHRSNATFQNVNYRQLPGAPKLTALEVKDVALTPAFDADVFKYSGATPVPFETESVQIKATAADGFDLVINDEEVADNTYVTVPLEVGLNSIKVKSIEPETKLSSVTTVNIKRQQDPDLAYTESYRPQFHFSQEIGWCNDPNGMVYFDGEWHLFYQYNVEPTWTAMHWGHAVSTDLINWTELPIALEPDGLGHIFSGSAVVDKDNTSGFFDGIPGGGLVAIFTHSGSQGQIQSIAYSTDKGRTWTKYEGNPVISRAEDPLENSDFRDPKVFWHEESNQWMMVTAGGPLRFHSSTNLKEWKFESGYDDTHPQYRPDGVNSIWTECPDFFKLKVEGTNTYKWVLNGCGRYYMIGDFKEVNGRWSFVPDTNEHFTENYAPDSYAAQTYFGLDGAGGTPDGRRIMINWMSNWGYANDVANITSPNTGAFTLQHELTLKETDKGIRMFQNPIADYEELRLTDKATTVDTTLTPDGQNPLATFNGDQYEIVAEFTPTAETTQVGFKLRTGGNQETLVYYNLSDGKMYIDRTKSGKAPNGNFLGTYSQETSKTKDGKIQMRIYVDWSSVEAFGNYGETVGTALIYPDFTSTGAEVYTKGGDADVNATIYPLKSIWREVSDTPAAPTDLATNIDGAKVEVGETVTLSARVLPVSAEQKVTWDVPKNDVVRVVSTTDNTITLVGLKKGTVDITATVPGTDLTDTGTVSVVKPQFISNVAPEKWEAGGGTWTIDEKGYYGICSGDAFLIAENVVENFTMTADITLESGQAIGIVYYAQGAQANTAGSYVINMDLSQNRFRIFEFPHIGPQSDIAIKNFADAGFTPERGRTYPIELSVQDGKMSFKFNNVVIFENVEDTDLTQLYEEGRIGFMGYNSSLHIQNYFIQTDSPIKDLVPTDDIVVEVNTDIGEVELPDFIWAEQEDGFRQQLAVTWNQADLAAVKMDVPGTYTVRGTVTVDGTPQEVSVKIVVEAKPVIVSLSPEQLTVSAEEGSTAEEVFAKLTKSVVATYSDDSTATLTLTNWDTSKVNFNKAGVYTTTGTLSLLGEEVAEIPIRVTILGDQPVGPNPPTPGTQKPGGNQNSGFKWPDSWASGSTTGGKKNPNSGDQSGIPAALAVLAVSAGAVVFLRRKK